MVWLRSRDYKTKSDENEKSFRPFHETYRVVAFALAMGMMYPHPATEKKRFIYIILIYLSVAPVTAMVLYDIYRSILVSDVTNITRHLAIIIPFLVVMCKICLMYHNRKKLKRIIDEIDRDHALYNSLPENYRAIIEKEINSNLRGEKLWAVNVFMCVGIFPIMSLTLNLYSSMFETESTKHMIHDINHPFKPPERRTESPYFETMMVYETYCCIIFTLNFLGYDGSFGVAINHACLKMKLYSKSLKDALLERDRDIMFEKIVQVICEQCRVFRLVGAIQDTFNVWLGIIFLGTIIHISNCLYQFLEGTGFDLRFFIFAVGAVIHVYLPCSYATTVKSMSQDVATLIYCSGWENVQDQGIRKLILFMIARSQIPLIITAFNIVTFDMELFVSMLQTTYSFFTLLRS